MEDLVIDRCIVPASDLAWDAVRASGPGGQNVNKVSTKVVLRFDLEGSRALGAQTKARLRILAANRIDAEGYLVLSSQRTRSLVTNLSIARELLAALIRQAMQPERRRRATRPSRASKARRLDEKRKRGDTKRHRGHVKNDARDES